ncbi:hypothetical protein [uncultured Desulfovibrio sp.]|uniref:hypothetical protein n=1 Tax=uncultured Desulfovibrio sp. TaxID=167968 RepID=UPI002628573A|nr:hypothetical protein [uncultured Desulfovibrio sp.]
MSPLLFLDGCFFGVGFRRDAALAVCERALSFSKINREAAAQRRPAQTKRKNHAFPRSARPYGLEHEAFQTEMLQGLLNKFSNNFNG